MQAILFDFDGVLINSMPIREEGFRQVLEKYPQSEVNQLLNFHQQNGGLSRYVKFRYFFEKIRNQEISDYKVQTLADEFSRIMLDKLLDKSLLIDDAIAFVKRNYLRFDMHIVSGSDGNELRKICHGLKVENYFKSISGSPDPKEKLVGEIVRKREYRKEEVILVGDSVNDYQAAEKNDIRFIGYNNPELKNKGLKYLHSFKEFTFKTHSE